MKKIVTGEEMKALDRYTIEEMGVPSLVLMERAGMAVANTLKEYAFPLEKVLILCGGGNNGADGVVIARLLHLWGYKVDVCILGNPEHFTEEMKKQIDIGKKYGLSFVKTFHQKEYTTIVDAIFGVGLSRNITGSYEQVIKKLEDYRGKLLSVDIPSGVCADTGQILGCAVHADVTVTFAFLKAGLCLYPGAACAGNIVVADIGIYALPKDNAPALLSACEKKDLAAIVRKPDGNKGTFGKILLVAGSKGMFGAAYLSGMAAMTTGAGMLKICTREENRTLFSCFPEAMLQTYEEHTDLQELLQDSLEWADVVGIGPGLGTSAQGAALLELLLAQCQKPLLIDADGLNLLKDRISLLQEHKGPVILTPHLGEFSRISGISPGEWKKNPLILTKRLAKELSAVLICKDARTVISTPCGRTYVNLSGNDALATAGSGDVLTGILLGLLAQGYSPEQAAYLGVYLHGAAGERAAEKLGKAATLARDIIESAGELLKTAQKEGTQLS